MPNQRSILLTGGTGYVGGRLIPLLEKHGYPLRCIARQPQHLESRVQSSTEIVQGDLFEPESLHKALDGIDTAFYMVHSLGTGKDFEKEDRTAALNFAEAARHANCAADHLSRRTW